MALVGALAGVVAGLLGVGGGIIMVPALTVVLPAVGVTPELSMHLAVATSLAVIIVTGSASARAHYRRGSVDVVRVGHWAIFVAAGAAGGALAARFLDGNFLRFAFGLLALFVASRLLFERQRSVRVRAIGRGAQRLIVGVIGMLSAWLGIGGGTMMVALLRSTGLAMHQA
ncbi:MAG: sulfite exporter TauE/SafE family protein, partial [Pseudomonadota bacterium]